MNKGVLFCRFPFSGGLLGPASSCCIMTDHNTDALPVAMLHELQDYQQAFPVRGPRRPRRPQHVHTHSRSSIALVSLGDVKHCYLGDDTSLVERPPVAPARCLAFVRCEQTIAAEIPREASVACLAPNTPLFTATPPLGTRDGGLSRLRAAGVLEIAV